MKPSLLSLNSRLFMFIALFLIGIPVSIYLLSQQQNLVQNAWSTDQSASAICDAGSGKVVIDARFTNTEANNPSLAMNVIAKDNKSGNQVDLGKVNPGETKRDNIHTNADSVSGGTVMFILTWSDSHSSGDSLTAQYGAAGPCPQPTSTPLTPTTVQPTETPIPPSPTPVPTDTPVPTPTTVLPTIEIPTPTGNITGCPVPGKVKNIKIICPFCKQ
jgi:hypothetical protein